MRQILNKKILFVLTLLLIIVTCTGCKTLEKYLISDYLSDLAYSSGISDQKDFDLIFADLYQWKIVDKLDIENKDNYLQYAFLEKTIGRLIQEDSLASLNDSNISNNHSSEDLVDKKFAKNIITLACEKINNYTFDSNYLIVENENVTKDTNNLKDGDIFYDAAEEKYKKIVGSNTADPSFEEVIDELIIEDSFDIDFENVDLITYGLENNDSNYINTRFNLLSTPNKETIVYNGFTIYYNVSKAGVTINVSKKNDNGSKYYADININKIQPVVKWHYKEGDVKNAYFKLNFNTTEKIGFNNSKYSNYYLKFKDLDSSSFLSLLKSSISKKDNAIDTKIPLFKIKIPIEAIPTASLFLDVGISINAEGKIELNLFNTHNIGFEIKDGKARFISDHDRDYDFIAQASAKTGLDVTLSLDVINNSLMDIGVNGGINASANTIVHLYDEEGNKNQENINLSYDVVNEVAKENKDVKVCSDLSLNWYADLLFNSSKTYLFKHGLTKKLGLLDEDNQLFGNLHHIENGHFVKQCTRESRTRRGEVPEEINSDKLLLNKTAIILKENETYKFQFSYIPKNYKASDLLYEIEDANIVSIKNDTIYPLNKGNTRILIKSKDGKYQTYLKVLVSE